MAGGAAGGGWRLARDVARRRLLPARRAQGQLRPPRRCSRAAGLDYATAAAEHARPLPTTPIALARGVTPVATTPAHATATVAALAAAAAALAAAAAIPASLASPPAAAPTQVAMALAALSAAAAPRLAPRSARGDALRRVTLTLLTLTLTLTPTPTLTLTPTLTRSTSSAAPALATSEPSALSAGLAAAPSWVGGALPSWLGGLLYTWCALLLALLATAATLAVGRYYLRLYRVSTSAALLLLLSAAEVSG